MPYLKNLSKKSSSPLSTSTQNTYSDPREKTILVLSKIICISGYVALVSFPIFLIEMYILKQFPYSLPILSLSFFLFCMLSFTCYLLRREVAKAARCKAEKEAIIVPHRIYHLCLPRKGKLLGLAASFYPYSIYAIYVLYLSEIRFSKYRLVERNGNCSTLYNCFLL